MTFWPAFIIGCVITLFVGYFVHDWDVNRIEAKQLVALNTQVSYDILQCKKDVQPAITSDSDEVKNLNDSLNSCISQLRSTSVSTPVSAGNSTSKPKAAKGPNTTITAYDFFYKSRVKTLNNIKDWATACIKAGNCQ